MQTFNRSILAISLLTGFCQQALPCADYDDPSMYNHFHCVQDLPSIEQRSIDESVAFWAHYTGLPIDEELSASVRYLRTYNFPDAGEDYSDLLLNTLHQQGKTDAIEFLRLNCELYDLCHANESWDYRKVTARDYEALLKRIDALHVSGELSRRKTFLKMRCLFALKDYDTCMRLWDTFASKWEECPLRDRMKGYVAGIYYRRGQYDRAIPMFFDLGDDGSIQLCVNRMLASTSIEQEYDKNPDSPILGYILEDYANYYYHATKNDMWEQGEDNPIWTTVTRDAQQNISLAHRVVSEGRASDLQMWQAFAGFLELTSGNYESAYQSFTSAETLRGGGEVAQCLRHYKFLAALKRDQKPADFDQYLITELQYRNNTMDMSGIERSVIYSLNEYEVHPAILDYVATKGDKRLDYIAEGVLSVFSNKWRMDRELSIDQILAIRAYLQEPAKTPLEAYFLDNTQFRDDEFYAIDEILGTKYMREGNYEEALSRFQQVPLSYYQRLGISYYLAERVMPDTGFDRRDYSEPGYDPESITENKKIEFCQNVIALQQTIRNSQGDAKASAEIELAKWLFQASPGGDLWGYSEYRLSTYDPTRNELSTQALNLLQDALQHATSYDNLVECHYGIAAICGTGVNPVFYDNQAERYYLEARNQQLTSYQWLRQQTDRSHLVFHTCDWLNLYIVEADED